MSFVSTAVLTTGMERLFARMRAGPMRFLVAAAVPISAALLVMAAVHVVAGTPEILSTMAPSTFIGYAYSFSYVTGLSRAQPGATEEPT